MAASNIFCANLITISYNNEEDDSHDQKDENCLYPGSGERQ